MLNLKWICENPDIFDAEMGRRQVNPLSTKLIELDAAHRAGIADLQALQTERNTLAKAIGESKAKGQEVASLLERSSHVKQRIPELEQHVQNIKQQLDAIMVGLPNILEADVPNGRNEADNTILRHWGQPPSFSFVPKSHDVLGEKADSMDFKRAAKLSGSRFVFLKGHLALLERALANYMIDLHTREFGYTLVSSPLLVRDDALFGTGQLPKFSEDLFQTTDGRWLIPTAEVPLTNLVQDEILDADVLPLRFVCLSPCFRSEAGAAGRDTRGMMRQHQFHKVELVSIVHPDQSHHEHERLLSAAEKVLQNLELPYRAVLLCSGDTGSVMRKTYDLEVWIPSENTYREISSCSMAGDFQARRMNARFKDHDDGRYKPLTHFVHTLNGSGVAVGRALIAVMENYQQENGSIVIPHVLRPYMNNIEKI